MDIANVKSKMEELLISLLVDEIETKSQRLNLHFRGQAIQGDYKEYCTTKLEVENRK